MDRRLALLVGLSLAGCASTPSDCRDISAWKRLGPTDPFHHYCMVQTLGLDSSKQTVMQVKPQVQAPVVNAAPAILEEEDDDDDEEDLPIAATPQLAKSMSSSGATTPDVAP